MSERLQLSARHREQLESLFREHLPDVEVWAYGSRVDGRSHDGSDLDLVLRGPGLEEIDLTRLADFQQALHDSTIPFVVEARDWARLPERFHREIERRKVVVFGSTGSRSDHLFTSLPHDWEVTTLGSASARGGGGIQTGPFGSQLHASDYVSAGIPAVMPKDIGDNRIEERDIARITPDDAKRLDRYLVRPGDILYSRRGDVGKRALVRMSQAGWLCGTGCLRVRFGEGGVDPRYASYYLGHPLVRKWIVRHAHGATMPNLNTSILSACPFVIPSAGAQRVIAHVLGTLDEKIELNRRMNATLEAMVRALFKSWFVNFDPVRAKMTGRNTGGVPADVADVFPDRLVDSGMAEIGAIPEGWEVGSLGDIACSSRRGVDPASVASDTPYIGLADMPRGSIALADWSEAGSTSSRKFAFGSGDVLFGKLRPYFHKVGIAPVDGLCSTDVIVVVPRKAELSSFVLACVASSAFVAYASQAATGTRMPRTSWRTMSKYPLCLPTGGAVSAFHRVVSPMLRRIVGNVHESRVLAALRDTLLPRLVSGEIHVSLERPFEGPGASRWDGAGSADARSTRAGAA